MATPEEKERRLQRRRNFIARDLMSNKYRQQVMPNRRRIDNEDGSYFFQDRYYDEDETDD